MRKQLLDEYGIEVAGGFGPLAGKIFRIGVMGPLATEPIALDLFFEAFGKCLAIAARLESHSSTSGGSGRMSPGQFTSPRSVRAVVDFELAGFSRRHRQNHNRQGQQSQHGPGCGHRLGRGDQ